MKTRANEAPHLPRLIGGVAVLLLGTFGIAAVMAWMPISTAVAGFVFAPEKLQTPPVRPVGTHAQIATERAEGDVRARVKCDECGVVESTRQIAQLGAAIEPGAAAGVTNGERNEMPGKSITSYEVTFRMKDGSSRVFVDANPANWRQGQRVIIIEGASKSNR